MPHKSGKRIWAGGAPEAVVALPHRAARRADLVGQVPLGAQAAELLARRREAPQLPVLVDRVHDPVDARVLCTQHQSHFVMTQPCLACS